VLYNLSMSAPKLFMPLAQWRKDSAFTLVESVFAMAVTAVALGATMTLNSHMLRLVKSAKETNLATLALQERTEQVRIANWLKVTDANYLAQTFFNTGASSSAGLENVAERITIRDYNPDPAAAPRIRMVVEKPASGAARVVESGEGLKNERLVRVDLRVTWRGNKGERIRESSTVVSNIGINRLSLPGFTGMSGTFSDFPTSPTTSTPPPTTSPTPGPTPTPTPTPTTGNGNGNGNGQGNVAGKPGKEK
jgi:type II secretory pathway pseudopilin PulG